MVEPNALVAAVSDALARVESVRVAYVFGSHMAGTARADSDLDVAILFDRSLDGWGREQGRRDVVNELTDRLGALGERTDVVDLATAGSSVAFRALRDGHRVVARDHRERVELEVQIMRRYDDDAPRRARLQRATVALVRGHAHGTP